MTSDHEETKKGVGFQFQRRWLVRVSAGVMVALMLVATFSVGYWYGTDGSNGTGGFGGPGGFGGGQQGGFGGDGPGGAGGGPQGGFGGGGPGGAGGGQQGGVGGGFGGGMYNEASSPTVSDCTFIGNEARDNGAASPLRGDS